LLPDAVVCLQALHGKAPLAILSDGPPEAQRNKVAALRLKQWFDAIFLTAEWGFEYAKPSPTAFQLAQKQFGCEAKMCYYVADNSLKDFIAPKKLGWRTVRVRRQRGLYSKVEANGKFAAAYEFRDLYGLPTLLKETLSLQL
jgi:putative hydrolase of the HAD superfamily